MANIYLKAQEFEFLRVELVKKLEKNHSKEFKLNKIRDVNKESYTGTANSYDGIQEIIQRILVDKLGKLEDSKDKYLGKDVLMRLFKERHYINEKNHDSIKKNSVFTDGVTSTRANYLYQFLFEKDRNKYWLDRKNKAINAKKLSGIENFEKELLNIEILTKEKENHPKFENNKDYKPDSEYFKVLVIIDFFLQEEFYKIEEVKEIMPKPPVDENNEDELKKEDIPNPQPIIPEPNPLPIKIRKWNNWIAHLTIAAISIFIFGGIYYYINFEKNVITIKYTTIWKGTTLGNGFDIFLDNVKEKCKKEGYELKFVEKQFKFTNDSGQIDYKEFLKLLTNDSTNFVHTCGYYFNDNLPTTQFFAAIPFGKEYKDFDRWMEKPQVKKWYNLAYVSGGQDTLKAIRLGGTGQQYGGFFKDSITTISDFKNKKIRFCTNALSILQKQFGGIPKFYTVNEIRNHNQDLFAFEGIGLEGIGENGKDPMNLKNGGFKYFYEDNWFEYSVSADLLMNQKFWNGINPEIRTIIEQEAQKMDKKIHMDYDAYNLRLGGNEGQLQSLNVTTKHYPKIVMDALKEGTNQFYFDKIDKMLEEDKIRTIKYGQTFLEIYNDYVSEDCHGLRKYEIKKVKK